ncbi:MAG: tyrosine-protein phosphatase [Sphingobium sp.]
MQRVLALHGIHNFRDYGGYSSTEVGTLPLGRLYRSAQHLGGTAEDLAVVATLDLGAVVDLRSPSEREAAPCPRREGFAATVYRIHSASARAAPHLATHADLRTAEDAREALRRAYAAMPFSPSLIEGLRNYFASLADTGRTHLVHCMAGKDRTGLAVALLHTMLGVHPDDRLADYLMTDRIGNQESRIAAGARAVQAAFPRLNDAGVRVMMGVDPVYLDTAFAIITQRHGTLASYCADVLGVDRSRRQAIIASLSR